MVGARGMGVTMEVGELRGLDRVERLPSVGGILSMSHCDQMSGEL